MSEKKNALHGSPGRDPALLEKYISGCADGSSGALAELYNAVSSPVFAYALSVLKNRQDAEDVLHDCFINIWSAAAGYTDLGKPMAWIMTITRNLCMNLLKDRRRKDDVDDDDWESCLSESLGISEEDRLTVRACMTKLSDTERKILLLHAVSGFKHREIADFLSMPLATVLSKYSRALKKLRSILEKEIYPDEQQ